MSEKDICLRFGTSTPARKLSVREMSVGSFSHDDGDGNGNQLKSCYQLCSLVLPYFIPRFFVRYACFSVIHFYFSTNHSNLVFMMLFRTFIVRLSSFRFSVG